MMIRNLAIGGVVGLLFMSGGFFVGMRFVHVPVPKKAVAISLPKAPATAAEREALSLDALRKTSEGMMDVNQALQAREQAVAAREKKAHERDDELDAERAALDRSHARFHELYDQFQQRLQLVQANEADQLQRQMTIYTTMDPAQAADLLRDLDDGTIVRLFSIMETKSLAKLVAAWKTKYPADSTRLLTALTQMGRVVPQDKIALPDPATTADANATPSDASSPADASASTAPADGSTPPAASPGADTTSSTPADSAPAPTAVPAASDATPDTAQAPAPDSSPSANAASPAADASSGATAAPPASTTSYSTPDASGADAASGSATAPAPAAEAAPQAPATPAAPALAPPPDTATGHGTATTPTATAAPASPSLLGVPGENRGPSRRPTPHRPALGGYLNRSELLIYENTLGKHVRRVPARDSAGKQRRWRRRRSRAEGPHGHLCGRPAPAAGRGFHDSAQCDLFRQHARERGAAAHLQAPGNFSPGNHSRCARSQDAQHGGDRDDPDCGRAGPGAGDERRQGARREPACAGTARRRNGR